ncbi:glutaredoxin family protein [Alkalimarinus alittae]|uniref:Glutaredoxin family protein n=1 Tax=Alkalimarinus alittae TaxID=2961619 RepID=A0ABY6MXM1_9ALTE|nr:glutaredoxin family protein [Alkalimarinus alittae]UZE94576.1 glutaredoxin family protein [Alkalimarinus alittae]
MLKKFIFIIIALVAFQYRGEIENYLFPRPDYGNMHEGKVILYATSWCGYCEKARNLMDENNIPFYEYNIETSSEGREQYQSLGGRGVPVLLINGNVIKGYSPSDIIKYAK